MGEVIQLFKDGGRDQTFVATEVLTEEFQDELAAVVFDIEQLFKVGLREDFETLMTSIKARVAGWPDG